jgi:hypothetical protein
VTSFGGVISATRAAWRAGENRATTPASSEAAPVCDRAGGTGAACPDGHAHPSMGGRKPILSVARRAALNLAHNGARARIFILPAGPSPKNLLAHLSGATRPRLACSAPPQPGSGSYRAGRVVQPGLGCPPDMAPRPSNIVFNLPPRPYPMNPVISPRHYPPISGTRPPQLGLVRKPPAIPASPAKKFKNGAPAAGARARERRGQQGAAKRKSVASCRVIVAWSIWSMEHPGAGKPLALRTPAR